jgi:hypothetical protein
VIFTGDNSNTSGAVCGIIARFFTMPGLRS